MKNLIVLMIIGLLMFSCNPKDQKSIEKPEWAVVIHGGAGNFNADAIPDSLKADYLDKMAEAIDSASQLLKEGGEAVDAVVAAIRVLEDSPLFNAGKGSVFTHDGHNEMDASIMTGNDLNAGAVAGLRHVKNPILAARLVHDKSKHVLLSGSGADEYARLKGLEMVDTSYFFTEKRWHQLQRILDKEHTSKLGTVGCVAYDKNGNLAAGTSTGGMSNKEFGRIGDSPIPGCGSYANNATCGISFTGHGEYIIRYTAAHDISALMEYKNLSLDSAMNVVIRNKLKKAGGDAGAIGIDKNGNIEFCFNTTAMFRAAANSKGLSVFGIGE